MNEPGLRNSPAGKARGPMNGLRWVVGVVLASCVAGWLQSDAAPASWSPYQVGAGIRPDGREVGRIRQADSARPGGDSSDSLRPGLWTAAHGRAVLARLVRALASL